MKPSTFREKTKGFSLPFTRLPEFFGSNYLHLFLDSRGNVLETSERWKSSFSSAARAILTAGHLRNFFEFPLTPIKPGESAILKNRKAVGPLDVPEVIFTSFPTFLLHLYCLEKDLHYGALRIMGLLPNIFLQRPNGIIYVDGEERLAGFNGTFFRFFREYFRTPEKMLDKPLSRFLNPVPSRIQADRLEAVALPDPVFMRRIYSADFSAGDSPAALTPSPEAVLRPGEGGLLFSNSASDDFASLALRALVPARRDFSIDLEFTQVSGMRPLIAIDEPGDRSVREGGDEYTLGPDIAGGRYQLKRRGVVQRTSPVPALTGRISWSLRRAGLALVFLEQGERRLFLHDPNYLHEGECRITLSLRDASAIRIHSLKLFSSETPSPPPALPVTRLKVPAANAFVINPMDNVTLSTSYPDLQGFVLENATELQGKVDRLQRENRRMLEASGIGADPFLGNSAPFVRLKETALRAAASDVAILLQGETGTGKEALARFIHGRSGRSDGPFVKVDCSSLPAALVESELFGHERGAFTGAAESREGLLEQARGGTLFLDEIGNLSREVQAKLLHFLQDHAFTRVGGRKPIAIDVRVISAGNVPLSQLIRQGAFRSDLYYRLAAVSITLPPLRERAGDIPELCSGFLRLVNARRERKIREISSAAYAKLLSHAWPGNIRELKNVVERAALFCDGEALTPELIVLDSDGAERKSSARRGPRPLKGLDAAALRTLFAKHGGVVERAARELGVSAPALYGRIKKLGLTAEALRRLGSES